MDEERTGDWTKDLHEVEAIKESEGQNIYRIENRDQWLVKAEILFVDA